MSTKSIHEIIETKIGTVPAVFLYALFELVLIMLLFLDGLIFFASYEFACFFELEIPCMLCTRINHVLVPQERDFCYMDSLCNNHAKYVSSFAYCSIHSRLATIHQMCNRCLLSFGAEKKSYMEVNKSTLGTLSADIQCSSNIELELASKRNKDRSDVTGKSRKHRCPCCNLSPRNRAFDHLVVNFAATADDDSSHISCTDTKFTLESKSETVEEEDCSGTVISEDDSNNDEKNVKNLNKKMFKAPDEVQEQLQQRIESQQVSLRERNSDVQKWKNIKLQRVLDNTNSFTASTSENHSDSNTKEAKCLDLYDVYKMISSTSISYGRTNSIRLPMLHRRLSSVGKDEACIGSFKGSNVSKVDGKNLLQRLKRRVRSEHKSLMALYTELEKERSASAVAADEAMAMITRLQQEKATVQMQALQYRRMMEEQAEYDQDALQIMSDLLMKKEKEMRSLEAKVETYRERFQFETTKYEEGGWEAIERSKVVTGDDYQRLNSRSNSPISRNSELQASLNVRVQEENDVKPEINCN